MTPQVLYTEDLEPITIVDVPEWLMERLRAGHHIQLDAERYFIGEKT